MLDGLIDPQLIRDEMLDTGLEPWAKIVESQLAEKLVETPHGDLARWKDAVLSFPEAQASSFDLSYGPIRVGTAEDVDDETREQIQKSLEALHPWRKGPYEIHGTLVDTEWHSDWKWERLAGAIDDLKDRVVLDVGCGNGYHLWRMAHAKPRLTIGVDPSPLFLMQFHTLKKFLLQTEQGKYFADRTHLLPLGIEEVPPKLEAFDTVFSMGVLYHRRSPFDHLMELRDALRKGGQLVLETLVIEGGEGEVLVPQGRYAKMRNVWFIPSVTTLRLWLQRIGLNNIVTVDVSDTSVEEQRSTSWMRFESLADFLDPADSTRTIEGYPAPKRAVITANK